jgi:hypothetical protein
MSFKKHVNTFIATIDFSDFNRQILAQPIEMPKLLVSRHDHGSNTGMSVHSLCVCEFLIICHFVNLKISFFLQAKNSSNPPQ